MIDFNVNRVYSLGEIGQFVKTWHGPIPYSWATTCAHKGVEESTIEDYDMGIYITEEGHND
jgi:hypothetical protein